MPRAKKDGAAEPKKRSRNGCWPCKQRKVKCGEEKPSCVNCEKQGEACDYSIRLNWGGRAKRSHDGVIAFDTATPSPLSSTFAQAQDSIAPRKPVSYNYYSPKHVQHPSISEQNAEQTSGNASMYASSSHAFTPQDSLRGASASTSLTDEHPDTTSAPNAPVAPMMSSSTLPMPIDPRLQAPHTTSMDYPTPSTPDLPVAQPAPMLPPLRALQNYEALSPNDYNDPFGLSAHRSKRAKLSPPLDSPSTQYSMTSRTPFSNPPLTPISSVSDETARQRSSTPASSGRASPDKRRLSVHSLLSGPPGPYSHQGSLNSESQGRQYPISHVAEGYTTYGYDAGQPDLDIPKNDDIHAVQIFSPASTYNGPAYGDGGRARDIAFEKGGYYERPVPIKIAKALEPLPSKVTENPMNLLYFHHFVNHTARILMPHDCEKNPLRKILPHMAVHDDNILNLLLAYSASHRARLLSHPEPGTRIANYVQDVFPQLRRALELGGKHITDSTLTAAIMLASLEIVSPNTFGVPVSWQSHLHIARQMIVARGGPQSIQRSDRVAYFLSRWFAYLDVIGSLSGSKNDVPLSSLYCVTDDPDGGSEYQIDCLLGFTSRCVSVLARIAELAKKCEGERLDPEGGVRPDWRPSDDIATEAEKLKIDLDWSREHVYTTCSHRPSITTLAEPQYDADDEKSETEQAWDSLEIYATNEAFHWAGTIHLLRRVLGKPREDPEVQQAVREIVGLLYKVRRGSTAEACLLLPMFTAGCDAVEERARERVLERLRRVEEVGLIQVRRARNLMCKVWETGKAWETLVEGEFFG